ncbi:hypothetical protein MMAN_27200 [Mycobacterium mantenii]|uniref:Transposase n=1 Tax=Mycobacterium mantenii TaxID=560555 RepID=A0ABN6AAQ9_MYCNT|nr:hypothetical protein MMAN_27200 [Mycobacterium mantenii]
MVFNLTHAQVGRVAPRITTVRARMPGRFRGGPKRNLGPSRRRARIQPSGNAVFSQVTMIDRVRRP